MLGLVANELLEHAQQRSNHRYSRKVLNELPSWEAQKHYQRQREDGRHPQICCLTQRHTPSPLRTNVEPRDCALLRSPA